MEKRMVCMLLAVAMLCTACRNIEEKTNAADLEAEIKEVLENASYENLEILFDEMGYYEGQDLVIATTKQSILGEGMDYKALAEMYVKEIFPSLMDVDEIDTQYVYDLDSDILDETTLQRTYTKNYDAMIASLDEYESMPEFIYYNPDAYVKLFGSYNWISGAYLSQGVLGTIADAASAFGAAGIVEEGKTYECRYDDLSDSYPLMDGEKTVAEAKEEMESYLNAHYPLSGEDNDIKNEIFQIKAGKISGTDYYAFCAYRTISYNGIPVREMPQNQKYDENEFVFMGECVLCESNKLDVTIGIINTYAKPEIVRTIDEVIPFAKVMENIADYLTWDTKFQLLYGGMEYRMFYTDDVNLKMIPYWTFIAKIQMMTP